MSEKEDMGKEQRWFIIVYGETVQQSISSSQIVSQLRQLTRKQLCIVHPALRSQFDSYKIRIGKTETSINILQVCPHGLSMQQHVIPQVIGTAIVLFH